MYIVKFFGDFGYIKPFTALRDVKTYSVKALPPSVVMGIETKLFDDVKNRILRHRLSFTSMIPTNEQTTSIQAVKTKKGVKKNSSMHCRYVLLNPTLYFVVDNFDDAELMTEQTIRLSRNEDILFPDEKIIEISDINEFDTDTYSGYELIPCDSSHVNAVWYGYNRYTEKDQYAYMKIVGVPQNLR